MLGLTPRRQFHVHMTSLRPTGPPDPVPDDAEAEQARIRAPGALAELYQAESARVYSLALRLTGSRQAAEDVLHDVFLALGDALERYEERGQMAAWLRGVTVRTALMHLRSRRRRREVALPDGIRSPGDVESAAAARLDLRSAIDRLPDTLRVVFVLKVIEGYSHDEIARSLGIRRGASEMRLSRAIRILRPMLEDPR